MPRRPLPFRPGPPPAGGWIDRPPSYAVLQPTEGTRTYPCPDCGGTLRFQIDRQLLVCDQCGDRRPLRETAARPVLEHELGAAVSELHQRSVAARVRTSGDREVVCQNCGGRTLFLGDLTTSSCPYCTTTIQRDDVQGAPDRLPVDGVLPFAVDRAGAETILRTWIRSRWFAPSAFRRHERGGTFNSVYLTSFTFDAWTRTWYQGERGHTVTTVVSTGKSVTTHSHTEWTPVAGVVENVFDDLGVWANDGFITRHLEALGPWPTPYARPYSPEFLAGHLARTYDHDLLDCFRVARTRMDAAIERTVRRDIGGDGQRIHRLDPTSGPIGYKQLLLPVWLLTVPYRGTVNHVLVNGVTGRIEGQRPYSVAKMVAVAAVALAVVVGLTLLIAYLLR